MPCRKITVIAFIASQSCRAAVLTCRPRVRVRAGNPGYAGELKAKVDAEVERIQGDPALQARVKEMVAADIKMLATSHESSY